jgi:hypothetical protein
MDQEYEAEYATVTEKRIKAAWKALHMPRLDQRSIDQEGDRWYVLGYDDEDDKRTYSVELAEDPGSFDGLTFEEL